MNVRFLCCALGLTVLVPAAFGQNAAWKTPRTADGKPDLSGFWSNNNATPLERPIELAGRATLTNEELAAMKKKAHELFDGKSDAAFGDSVFVVTFENVKGERDGFKSVDGQTGDCGSASGRGAGGQVLIRALHYVWDAAADGGISEPVSDCSVTRGTGVDDGNDSRCARDSDRRRAASSDGDRAVAWGFAGALGRRHAGGRHDELQAARVYVDFEREAACD